MLCIVGIDPGIFGAVAIIRSGPQIAEITNIPIDAAGLAGLLRLTDDPRGSIGLVVVELQTAMPRQGRTAIATQMRRYGEILGVCEALGLPVRTIAPVAWKRRFGLLRLNAGDVLGPPPVPTTRRQSELMTRRQSQAAAMARKRESLAHAHAVPNFTVSMPKRCNMQLQIGMADATLLALAAVAGDPLYKPFHWRI